MIDNLIYIPELGIRPPCKNIADLVTEYKVVEFEVTDPGINTDEGFFFFNLETKHCGKFLYRTYDKKVFIEFGNLLEQNHRGPYKIEVIKDTNYICSIPEISENLNSYTQFTIDDLIEAQIGPLVREYKEKLSIEAADNENIKNTLVMFKNMIKDYKETAIPKESLIADIDMLFGAFFDNQEVK